MNFKAAAIPDTTKNSVGESVEEKIKEKAFHFSNISKKEK
jgi:hypothetical protein